MEGWTFRQWAMAIAAIGVIVAMTGLIAGRALQRDKTITARMGDTLHVGPYHGTFVGVEPVAGPGWTALQAVIDLQRGDAPPQRLRPQQRFDTAPLGETHDLVRLTTWDGQLSAGLDGQVVHRNWLLHLRWTPLVPLVWLGEALMLLGALFYLGDHARNLRADKRRAWEAEENWVLPRFTLGRGGGLMVLAAVAAIGLALWQRWPAPIRPVAATGSVFSTDALLKARSLSAGLGGDAQWLDLSSAMIRSGDTQTAVLAMRSAITDHRTSADLWAGLGVALTAHGGGRVLPPAAFAFRHARALDPAHRAPGIFLHKP